MDRATFQDTSRNMRNPHTIDIQEYQGENSLSAPQAYYTDKDSYADAWADQGHFPLHLDRVSHTSIPARGGARITFTGENFREGVQVAFEYPRLGVSKVIIPKVLKSTEMEVISPDLLEWCAIARKKYHSRELCLSISLLCGGVKDSADNTTVEMVAREALDFARQLGNEEIEQVLEATLDAAKGFKKAVQEVSPRPLPIQPLPPATGSGGHPSPHFKPPSVASTPHVLHRPLPPTPSLTSSSLESGSNFSPLIADTKLDDRYQLQHYLPPSHPPPAHEPIATSGPYPSHRINTPQAFVEEPVPMPTPKIPHPQYPGMYAPPTGPPPPPMAFPQYPPPQQEPHFYEPPRLYYPERTHHPTTSLSPTSFPGTPSLPPAPFPGTPSLSPAPFPGTPSLPPAPFPGTPSLPPASYPGSSFPSMPVPEPKPSGQYSFLNEAPPSVHPVHPPPPLRANSSPLPQRPCSSNGSQSDIYNSPVNTNRPLPVAPFTPPTPLPPPKHIVTRVNRPKQFTIPQHQAN
ncbi:hypothetical protein BG005_009874 [Podila minutissima]|nr:hypothetical protein BG005_009874 [Podila minutissima]